MLQSTNLRNAIGILYEVSFQGPGAALVTIRADEGRTAQTDEIQTAYTEAERCITEPWVKQTKQRRRRCGAHMSRELLRLWRRNKSLYDRMNKWPTTRNRQEYSDACAKAQRRERQLQREQMRRMCQRIQNNPTTDIAKALRTSL